MSRGKKQKHGKNRPKPTGHHQPRSGVPTCPHADKAVNKKTVLRILKDDPKFQKCQECLPNGHGDASIDNSVPVVSNGVEEAVDDLVTKTENLEISDTAVFSPTLFFCVTCGLSFCASHFRLHHTDKMALCLDETPHSVFVNRKNAQITCIPCDVTIQTSPNAHLMSLIEKLPIENPPKSVLKTKQKPQSKGDFTPAIPNGVPIPDNMAMKEFLAEQQAIHDDSVSNAPSIPSGDYTDVVKGLSNLGNTCYFNSTLQCLVHCKSALDTVLSTPLSREYPGAVSQAFRNFIKDYFVSSSGNIKPGALLGAIGQRIPRFRGRQQQDANELMVHLLDTMHCEELKGRWWQKTRSESGNPDADETSDNEDSSHYKNGISLHSSISNAFCGRLVNSTKCCVCRTVSRNIEPAFCVPLPIKLEHDIPSSVLAALADNDNHGKKNKKKKGGVNGTSSKDDSATDNADSEADISPRHASKRKQAPEALPLAPSPQLLNQLIQRSMPDSHQNGDYNDDSDEGDGLLIEFDEFPDDDPTSLVQSAVSATKSCCIEKLSGMSLRKPPKNPKPKTLEYLLKRFCAEECLSEDNLWHCSKCASPRRAVRRTLIHDAPVTLVFQLKRFTLNNSGRTIKLDDHIDFPLFFEPGFAFSRSIYGDERPPSHIKAPMYELVGVVEHIGGSLTSGHYVAYVKTNRDEWSFVSDMRVNPTTPQKVLTAQAFLLFYTAVVQPSS